MAIDILDGNGAAQTIKSRTDGSDQVPAHDIDQIVMPSALYSAQTTVGTSAVAIGSSQAIKAGVTVTADPDNTNDIWVGPTGVTTGTGKRLRPGQSVFVQVANIATVFAISDAAAQAIDYIAS